MNSKFLQIWNEKEDNVIFLRVFQVMAGFPPISLKQTNYYQLNSQRKITGTGAPLLGLAKSTY